MSELSPEAKGLLDETRSGDQPSAHDRERLRGKLMAELGAVAFAGATVATAATASSSAAASAAPAAGTGTVAASSGFGALTLGKLALTATLVGALGAGVFVSLRGAAPAPTTAAVASQAVKPAPIAQIAQPEPAPVVTQLEPTAAPMPAEPVVEAREKPAPRRAVRAEKPAEEAAPVETDSADALTAELDLLSRAQAALRNNDPKLALSLVHEHEARFANGSLREERIGVAALSRCRLGEDHAAVLAEFNQAAPHSPMAARVRAACAPQ